MAHKKLTAAITALTAVTLTISCHKSNVDQKDLKDFKVVNLVANTQEYHPRIIDRTLINGFGIAWSPGGTAWVNSVGGGVSELYNSEGDTLKRVKIPSRTDTVGGLPCGIVFNSTKGFKLSNGNPAAFIFTGFDGVLSAWNGVANTRAERMRAPMGASYTGLAIGVNKGRTLIYGANFGLKKIDTWDSNFNLVKLPFVDPGIPQEYSPYNIQAVGDWLFVIYGKLRSDGHGVAGAGLGFVSVFNTDGTLVKRFASHGTLNLPWGVTMAPGSFLEDQDMGGEGDHGNGPYGIASNSFSNTSAKRNPKDPVILVGNFGDGRINVYTQDGKYLGQLQSHKRVLEIEGLWALSFAPTTATQIPQARLYFSAGPDAENDGVFGYLIKD
ncbi:MAG: TIGR03118 family protein [Bacteroidetes bacterium]|nr:TIGR03118 family protein [Bacteroidota bacterium]